MFSLEFIPVPFLIFAVIVLCSALVLLRRKVALITASNARFKSIFESIWRIEKSVLETLDFETSTKEVVNIILTELGFVNYGYEVIVLTLLDKEKQGLRRIAISNTEAAEIFLRATPIPFNDIVIPFSASGNLSIRAINERKMFVTQNVSEILVPALNKEWVDEFQKNLGIQTSIVYPIIAKDKVLGSLIFSLSKARDKITEDEWVILDSFVGAVGIALDNALLFRSLNEATQKLTVANERLSELDKLKDEFVSLASHELRTPMTAIRSYVWLLLYGNIGQLSPKQKTYLEYTYMSTERLIKLVNDMLNISRIESGRLTIESVPTDMGKLLEEVVFEIQARADEVSVHVVYSKPDMPIIARADPTRIREVVINLIGNSIKFTPKEGTIYIKVVENQGFVETSIRDTGRGISELDISKLFKKFNMVGGAYLTKERGQGTGLGLYLSKSLVELHGGKIWAASEGEGKGSTFTFTLPIVSELGPQPSLAGQINTDLPPSPNPQG